jgi:hypothetical protein
VREEFTDEEETARFEAMLRRSLQTPVPPHASRPHLRVVRDSAPPPPLPLPYPMPWWDRPLFAFFLIATLAGLATAIVVMVR